MSVKDHWEKVYTTGAPERRFSNANERALRRDSCSREARCCGSTCSLGRLPDSTQKLSRKRGRVKPRNAATKNCLKIGVHAKGAKSAI
jgi:hypothetical protein